MKILVAILLVGFTTIASAASKVVNVYIWNDYLSNAVISQFTKETGIRVDVSEYTNNETMYAKLKATPRSQYDLVIPSSYFIGRMIRQGMLQPIDKSKLTNFKNLRPELLNISFDPDNKYSIPFVWGMVGIVVNTKYYSKDDIVSWQDLWNPKYANQLLMLDDLRDVFAMVMLVLGYPVNDTNPEHIKQAYLKLMQLSSNIKIFSVDAVSVIYTDEDARIGMGNSGDIVVASQENPALKFIFPKEGFTIWMDSLVIVKDAPNLENAYKLIDFLMRPDIAKLTSSNIGYSTPNAAALKLFSKKMQQNPVFNPPAELLKKGFFQTDIDENALRLYSKYWDKVKIAG